MPSPWFKRKLFKSVRNPECVLSRDSLEERLFETRCMQESKNAAPFCLPVLHTRSPREWWREASDVNYTKISLMRKAQPGAPPVDQKFRLPCVKRDISSLHAQGAPGSGTPVSAGVGGEMKKPGPGWFVCIPSANPERFPVFSVIGREEMPVSLSERKPQRAARRLLKKVSFSSDWY